MGAKSQRLNGRRCLGDVSMSGTHGYGAFMLRNALAVANVLEIEDGELGY